MQEHPWFKDWFNSPYYHQLYFKRNDAEAAAFMDILIAHLRPSPNARILDVACGRGRHSIHLSEKGFDVTGIDLSEDSIKEALLHETETLHFYQHDMRLPFRINYFDYAFNFFTSFGYFKTRREHDNTIRMIAQSLKSNGCFVLDYLNVRYAEDHMVNQVEKELDDTHYHITKWQDKAHFYKKIHIEDKTLQQPLEYIETVAKFSLGDFKRMFACHGLHIKEVFGDYNLGEYDPIKSPRMIVVATK